MDKEPLKFGKGVIQTIEEEGSKATYSSFTLEQFEKFLNEFLSSDDEDVQENDI